MPGTFFQLPTVGESGVFRKLLKAGRGFGEVAVSDVLLHLIPFVTGQSIPLRRHRSVVIVEICRSGLSLFTHDIDKDHAAVVAKGATALREENLFVLGGQVVQGVAGVHYIEMVCGSLSQHGDHVPAEQIYTDSEWLQVVSGDIESVRGEIASAVLSDLPWVQDLADMGGVSASEIENIEWSLAGREQLSYSSGDLPVKHEIVADDLLVGAPGFAEDVDRVCVHIEDVLLVDVNASMLWCMTGARRALCESGRAHLCQFRRYGGIGEKTGATIHRIGYYNNVNCR